jgi:hypothetical protein
MNIVPYPNLFLSIFYLKFLEHGKEPFGLVKDWGKFESIWNKFDSVWFGLKTESGALCYRPHQSAPHRPPHHAALHRTQTLMTGPPSRPGPPVSHVDPHHADPAALHCRAETCRPLVPRSGHCRANATPPHCSTPRQGPPLSRFVRQLNFNGLLLSSST